MNKKGEEKLTWSEIRMIVPQIWRLFHPRPGMMLLGMLLLVVSRLLALVLPASTRYFIDDVVGKERTDLLWPLIALVLFVAIAQAATSFALWQLLSRGAQRLIVDLRKRIQQHILHLPLSFYDSHKTGEIVARIMTDVDGLRNLIGTGFLDLVGGVFTAVIAIGVLLWISPAMTALTVVCAGFVLWALVAALARIHPIFRERSLLTATVIGRLTESIGGIRVVKAYRAEEREIEVFSEGAEQIRSNAVNAGTALSMMNGGVVLMLSLVGVAVMLLGANQIASGKLTLGGFATFAAFLVFLIAPILQVVGVGVSLADAFAGLSRIQELLQLPLEDADPRRSVEIDRIQGWVRLEDITFSYQEGKLVLQGISFEAVPGTVTALVGSSGSGKSTITSLIAAFHTPQTGRVLIDGVDLATVCLDGYRKQLGVVLQETFLFDGTIYENVVFARPTATPEQVISACQIARVSEFAERLPDGYETLVGERGIKLSGGQRQRLSIARALLADPRILIFDEATSNLDSESEVFIQRGLASLMQGRTTFVIAHRLSTIRQADQVLVVEEGRIVERGTHEFLVKQRGRYYELSAHQHAVWEEANEFISPVSIDDTSSAIQTGSGIVGFPLWK